MSEYDPIQWWAGRRSQFPNLSHPDCDEFDDILAILGEFAFYLHEQHLITRLVQFWLGRRN
jgi:hypothetical protein